VRLVFALVFALNIAGCAAGQKSVEVQVPAVALAPSPAPDPVPAIPPPPPVPQGYVRMTVAGAVDEYGGAAVALVDDAQKIVVAVHVSGTEATSIKHRLERTRYARPLTHDLMDELMREVSVDVVRAQVDKLEDNTFYGTLVLRQKGRYIELDSRPSDAIALAIGSGAPIWVAGDLLTRVGVPRASFEGLDETP